jgi:general nucleoside transport system permease protein
VERLMATSTAQGRGPAARPGAATASGTRTRVLGFVYVGLGLFIAFAFGGASGDARFQLNLGQGAGARVPDLVLAVRPAVLVLAAVCVGLGAAQLARGFGRRTNVVLGVVAAIFVFAFLTWAARGSSVNLVGILQSTLLRAVPLTLGALCGVLCERSGVIDVAIEGQFLIAAFAGALVGSAAQNSWVGLAAGVVSGGLVGAILAVLTIRYQVDQIIVGVVLDVFALGITGFLFDRLLVPYQNTLNSPTIFGPVQIPVLSKIPIVGSVLFDQSVFVYLMLVLVAAIQVALFRTRYGLRVRAVGEHPQAADTVGISVTRVRYRNVILGGLVAGVGGAYFTLGSVGSFDKGMTAGRGFIALAAMIVGRWSPMGAFAAALVFGFADALQSVLAILNVPIPSQFLLMTPYVVTILVVAGVVGRARPPAADGKPYVKE